MAKTTRKMIPAMTPEAREQQLIALAIDEAERQLIAGTASSQVITHFLKLASTKNELEKEKLRKENAVLEAKAKAYQSGEELKELCDNAIKAMRDYSGHGGNDNYEE
nr:hypothetical protein [uncultured Mediterraneibacter sp.]